MKQSLLDIIHQKPTYNFSAYKKDSYHTLIFLLEKVRRQEQSLREESVSSGVDEDGSPFITFDSEEVMCELQRYDAEIKYMERLIRIRRFWRPRDFLNAIREEIAYLHERLIDHRDMRQRKRIAAMTPEKRIEYYRKRVQAIEKKVITLYSTYAPEMTSDCSYTTAHSLITSAQLRKQIEPLLDERCFILDAMFRATPEEVARLTEINDKLNRHMKFMKQQLINLYKADVGYSRGKDLDEMYEAQLCAYPLLAESFEGEEFYGSDFSKILEIEYALLSDISLEPCAWMRIYLSDQASNNLENPKIDSSGIENEDYTEYWRKVDALRDIKFCYPLHHMSDHQNLPLVDILHKTSFSIDLKHEIGWSKENIVD